MNSLFKIFLGCITLVLIVISFFIIFLVNLILSPIIYIIKQIKDEI